MDWPTKKYNLIYADPAWTYDKSGGVKSARGLAKTFYETMSIDEIKSLPVAEISDKNCYLFLWATAPNMPQALETLNAWGFEFSTIAFIWIKTNKNTNSLFWGMGNSTRANPEFVLLGKKGQLERKNADIHSVVMSPIREHSKKPNEIRKRILSLYGNLPRIELFARKKIFGWDVWGNDPKLEFKTLEDFIT